MLKSITKLEVDLNRDKIFNIKSAIIWAHANDRSSFPILYVKKPKHITQEEFEWILEHLLITIKSNLGNK